MYTTKMTKKAYTKENLLLMSWEDYGNLLEKLVQEISDYAQKFSLKFDLVAPILRGGAIPAITIANKLDIVQTFPIQLKYNSEWKIIEKISHNKILESYYNVKNILLVDNYTCSGDSAQYARKILIKNFPDSNIYFATTENLLENETAKRNGFEYFFVGNNKEPMHDMEKKKVAIYPFQKPERELESLNGRA